VREQIAGALEEVHVLLRSGELHLVALLRWRLVPRRRGTPTHPSRFVVAPRCAIRVARPISWSRSRRQLAHRIERPDEFAPRRIARRGQLRAERFDARRHIRQRIELARQLGDRALGAEAVVRLRRAAPAEVGRHPQRRTDWRPRRFACRRVATRPIRLPASLRARDRRSHRPCSAGPQLKVRREMTTRAEQYFLEQLAPHGTDAKDVVASGYFRTFIRDRSGRRDLSVFVDAAKALGHYLALTNDKLFIVKTRAPATSTPLLENRGVVEIPLSRIRQATLETDLFLIESDVVTLPLQLQVSNKSFPDQERLLEEFAKRFNVAASIASIRAAQAKKRWTRLGLVAAAIAAVVLWTLFKNWK
jgi:hypothetical protein